MEKGHFIKICSDTKFWHWINKKILIPYERVSNKNQFLTSLANQINNRTYYPNPPKQYLTINKGFGVIRIVPVLRLEDLCVYYYCVSKLEKHIAINRTAGTYGGFGLSGKLREVEQKEINKAISNKKNNSNRFGDSPYAEITTINPKAWFAEWGDFTEKIYFNSSEFSTGYAAELDISNFYDSIQLDNLEFKLRKYVSHHENEIIYLLLHFLRYWNRHINFYRQQGAGIPQDLFGECSRILSNFYLQSYDERISKFCIDRNAKFFRYADDQIFFAKSKGQLEEIISKASSLLMREGLNFNQKKVHVMPMRNFRKFYCFTNFISLAKRRGKTRLEVIELEKQIRFYLHNKQTLRKNGISLLKAILNILGKTHLRPTNFAELKKSLLADDFLILTPLQYSEFLKIYNILTKREKTRMSKTLLKSIESSYYTDRLYNLKRFFRIIKEDTKEITHRIAEIKKFYGFDKINQ